MDRVAVHFLFRQLEYCERRRTYRTREVVGLRKRLCDCHVTPVNSSGGIDDENLANPCARRRADVLDYALLGDVNIL